MRFFRIVSRRLANKRTAFLGRGATAAGRWNYARPALRAVYASDSLALAYLELLGVVPATAPVLRDCAFFTVDVPDELVERAAASDIPGGWVAAAASRETRLYGTAFLSSGRSAGLLLPSGLVPVGRILLLNTRHPSFSLDWVSAPQPLALGRPRR